jgi:hypothetical protein
MLLIVLLWSCNHFRRPLKATAASALLVAEIADASLGDDLDTEAATCAHLGLPEL